MRSMGILVIAVLLYPGGPGLLARQPSASQKRPVTASEAGSGSQGKSTGAPEGSTYVIGPEDILDISVWKQPDVSRQVPVRLDGKVSLPLLNDIQAAGLTPMQLAAKITERLKTYIMNPQVTVTVTAVNSENVFAVGELNRPGPIRLLPGMTVLQAVSSAGGITQFGDQKHDYVLRHVNGKDVRYPFNYRNILRGDMRGNIVLESGDTIVVP